MSPISTITSLSDLGDGTTRENGKVIFVAGALPGESVEYDLFPGKRFDRGVLSRVVVPSPTRRPTPCAHDHPGGCGGCNLLHATAEGAAAFKASTLKAAFTRAGIPCLRFHDARSIGDGLGYRNHARFFVVSEGRMAYVARSEGPQDDARAKLPIEKCHILHPHLSGLFSALQGRVAGVREVELRCGAATGELLALLHGDALPKGLDPTQINASIILVRKGGIVPFRGIPCFHEVVAGVKFRVSHDAFFQVNTAGAEVLVRIVRELAGDLGPKTFAIDLHAGVGLFALTALSSAGRCLAVEAAESSARDLRFNAESVKTVRTRPGRAAEALSDLIDVREVPDVVVADPPRAGLEDALPLLLRLKPKSIIYVSCEPQSLVRDVAQLVLGGYVLEDVVPVDLFGGTSHLETIVRLKAT